MPRRARVIALLCVVAGLLAAFAGSAQARSTYGATTLALDPGAAAALGSLGVTPGVVAPAQATGAGLAFPITTPPLKALITRRIDHSGGISLTAGATTVTLTDFTINLDRDPDLTAVLNGGPRASILKLSLRGAMLRVNRGFTLGPVAATLTPGAAEALNGAFGVTAFTAGLKLGDATVNYQFLPRH
jgi:hypothetical protein